MNERSAVAFLAIWFAVVLVHGLWRAARTARGSR